MQIEQHLHYAPTDDVTLQELLQELYDVRFMIVLAALILAGAGAATGMLRKPQYEASVVTMAATEEMGGSRSGGLGAVASQLGALGSLTGLAPTTGTGKKEEAIAVLQSQLLTEKYIVDNDLLPILFADDWDAAARKWKVEDPEDVPTPWVANQYFGEEIRELSDDKKTGIVTLTIRWTDPKLAAKWANDLVRLTNEYLRDKTIRESQRNIRYLHEQASLTESMEARRAIYALLQEEINKEMLARGRDEYALKIIDPAVVPEKSSSRGPVLLALAGAAFGSAGVAAFAAGRRIFMGPRQGTAA